ncbi:WD repeat-containing protein 89-like [Lineus longissimus]|uniref:WD repeat-containing protein 89-like n=1 Tax=Lineus longissimus TaxID=88925 RepID=UPI002B4EF66C
MTAEELTEMVWRLSDLCLSGKSSVSLKEKEPEYVLHTASPIEYSDSSPILAATTSDYCVRLYNRSNLASFQVLSGHTDVVTDIRFSHTDSNLLYTSSIDETIRCWDIRIKGKKEAQIFKGYESSGNRFLSCDISAMDALLCAGTECDESSKDALIVFWDVRMKNATGTFTDSHSDHITQVRFHPSHFHKMASGSVDGLVCLFDLREQGEDNAITQILNAESSVNQIGWCKRDGMDSIYCTTSIETMYVWNEEGDMLSDLKSLREDNEESHHIDYLVDCFYDNEADNLYLVAGDHSGSTHIFSVDGNSAPHVHSLSKGHKATLRCLTWDQKSKTLVTGGEDSMVCLWKSDQVTSPKKKVEDGAKLKSKKKERGKKQRDKPY